MSSLRRVDPGADRDPHLELLYLADDAVELVRARRDEGDLFVYEDGDTVIGAVQVVEHGPGEVELYLVAVEEIHQGRGHGRAMLDAVVDELGRRGARRVLVGTASSSPGTIGFYQKAGFRILSVERDHFDEARGYDGTQTENGIVIRDLVWFDRELP